jgi:hypothetical protein
LIRITSLEIPVIVFHGLKEKSPGIRGYNEEVKTGYNLPPGAQAPGGTVE